MTNLKFTNKAVDDLNCIWEYTLEKWSSEQAEKYYNMLINHCRRIAKNPDLGKNYEGVRGDLFGLKCSRHIIFYRKDTDNSIEITRILHKSMDLKNRLRW